MQLFDTIVGLLSAAHKRQLWMLFLDEEHRLLDPLMPMEELPEDPEELDEIEDLGLVTAPWLITHRARQIAQTLGARSFVLVWERTGERRFSRDDLDWARAFVDCGGRRNTGEVYLRAVFLLHDGGLRQFVADDLIE